MQHRRQIILDNLAITIFTSIPFLSRHPPLGSLFAMYCYYFDLHPFSIYLVFVFLRSRRQRPGGAAPTDRRINFLSPSSTSRLSNSLYPSPPPPPDPRLNLRLPPRDHFSNALNAPTGSSVLRSTHRDSSILFVVIAFRHVTGIYIAGSMCRAEVKLLLVFIFVRNKCACSLHFPPRQRK